jgi:hypothetical protein
VDLAIANPTAELPRYLRMLQDFAVPPARKWQAGAIIDTSTATPADVGYYRDFMPLGLAEPYSPE